MSEEKKHHHHHHGHRHECITCSGAGREAAAKSQPVEEHNRTGLMVLAEPNHPLVESVNQWLAAGDDHNSSSAGSSSFVHDDDAKSIESITNQDGVVGAAFLEITDKPLDINWLTQKVAMGSEKCGAVSTFLGTTRDHYNGRRVLQLEYESYYSMAMTQMRKIVKSIYADFEQVHRVVFSHRIGVVPITEPSVFIAVATEHRGSGLEAASFAINTLKARVPFWKKEIYAADEKSVEGSPNSQWKRNPEFAEMVESLRSPISEAPAATSSANDQQQKVVASPQ